MNETNERLRYIENEENSETWRRGGSMEEIGRCGEEGKVM